jgi:hypothetical protein
LFAATVCRDFAANFFLLCVKFAAKLPHQFAATLPQLCRVAANSRQNRNFRPHNFAGFLLQIFTAILPRLGRDAARSRRIFFSLTAILPRTYRPYYREYYRNYYREFYREYIRVFTAIQARILPRLYPLVYRNYIREFAAMLPRSCCTLCRDFAASMYFEFTASLPRVSWKFAATYPRNYRNNRDNLSFQFVLCKLEV